MFDEDINGAYLHFDWIYYKQQYCLQIVPLSSENGGHAQDDDNIK